MSWGLIPRQNKVSEGQFIGDLMSLFARHRIEAGDSRGFEHFYSRLAASDAFRSQLFTLCTAISHMSDEDLSGEQLLDLIVRGLSGRGDGVRVVETPTNVRLEFLSGYEAWGRRDLYAPWPPDRQAPRRDEPLLQPEDEDALAAPSAPETQVAGMRTIQEAIGLARRQLSMDEAERGASPAGVNVEGLTLSELTKLLEEIERRMSRIKPQVHELTAAVPSLIAAPDRPSKAPESSEEVHVVEAVLPATVQGPSLVVLPVEAFATPVDVHSVNADEHPRESAFLARHAYLRGGRRLPPDMIVPDTSVAPFLVPAIEPSPVAPIAPSPVAIPAPPPVAKVFDPKELTDEEDEFEFEEPRRVIIVPRSAVSDYELSPREERVRFKIRLSVVVFAAILFVGSPLAGVVAYQLMHPRARYVERYQTPAPAVQSSEEITVPGSLDPPASKPVSQESVQPGNRPVKSAAAKPHATIDPTSRTQASHPTHKVRPTKPKPPVAVWPPVPK
jgi:hypothetical protein